MTTIKERVMQLLEHNRIAKEKFFASIGVTSANFRGNASKTPLNSTTIENIFSEIPDLNLEWLITGNGNMLKSDSNIPMSVNLHSPGKAIDEQQIPIYDVFGSYDLNALLTNQHTPTDYMMLPNLPKCDGAVYMRNDMMAPDIQKGDLVVFKKVNDLRKGLFLGELYLMSVELEGEEYILVQRILQSDEADCVKLVSRNEKYPPKDIPQDAIKSLAMIKASVRYNTMM